MIIAYQIVNTDEMIEIFLKELDRNSNRNFGVETYNNWN